MDMWVFLLDPSRYLRMCKHPRWRHWRPYFPLCKVSFIAGTRLLWTKLWVIPGGICEGCRAYTVVTAVTVGHTAKEICYHNIIELRARESHLGVVRYYHKILSVAKIQQHIGTTYKLSHAPQKWNASTVYPICTKAGKAPFFWRAKQCPSIASLY
ncbi:hypothetical protein HOY82DRAFT_552707 [Tuber indicum]|nr:hypothetical protein HOY82DRAFT_552707 [Tuber indicum]